MSPLSHLVAETVAGRTPCGNGVRSDALARADLQSGRDRADLPHDRIEVSSRNGSNGALHATLKRRLSILPSSKMKESTARRTRAFHSVPRSRLTRVVLLLRRMANSPAGERSERAASKASAVSS